MIYAPVCIPTLNRYEHLRKCLESLSKCTWAEKTEVYVALDYPPLDQWDKYASGWEKNREFLHSCGDMGFKKLHVIEREENYGIWLPGHRGNAKCLIQTIQTQYDRYIFSEDDNIFAPAFLEYMDKGLELFKDDKMVYSISGYRFYHPFVFDNSSYMRQCVDYSPWGIGHWTNKKLPDINYKWFRKKLSLVKIYHLTKTFGFGVLPGIVSKCSRSNYGRHYIDNDVWSYMQISGVEQINPTVTLVHNIGLDGSGVDMPDTVGTGQEWCNPDNNPIATSNHFDFIGNGYDRKEENQRIYYHGKYWMSEWQYFIKTLKKLLALLVRR